MDSWNGYESNAGESLLILEFEFKTKSSSFAYDELSYIV